jgi:hypothetical protein
MMAMICARDALFKGVTADLLLAIIPMYSISKKEGDFHSNILNPSETGKSRMVDEVA